MSHPTYDYRENRFELAWSPPSLFGHAQASIDEDVIVTVDPARPWLLQSISVPDVLSTAETLQRLLGTDDLHIIENTLAALDPPGTLIPVTPTPAIAAIKRLALANWYEEWSPLAIPQHEALFDIATAAHEAHEIEQAALTFQECADDLIELSASFYDRAASPALLRELTRALTAANESLGPNHQLAPQLHHWLEALTPNGTEHLPPDWDLDSAGIADLQVATYLGPQDSEAIISGVDWLMVRPGDRVVNPDEHAVTWRVAKGNAEINVDAHPLLDPSSPRTLTLLARFIDRTSGHVITGSMLEFDAAARSFTATIPAHKLPADTSSVTLDVYSADAVESVAVGPAQHQRTAQRWATRSLCTARLSAAASTIDAPEELLGAFARMYAEQADLEIAPNQPAELTQWQADLNRDPITAIHRDGDLSTDDPGAADIARPLLCELLLADRRGNLR